MKKFVISKHALERFTERWKKENPTSGDPHFGFEKMMIWLLEVSNEVSRPYSMNYLTYMRNSIFLGKCQYRLSKGWVFIIKGNVVNTVYKQR